MSDPSFAYETVIATTPERLWEAPTSGEISRTYWFDRRIDSTWAVGAPVPFFDGAPLPATRVSFTLEPQDGGVRLLLVHDEPAGPEDVEGWRRGWTPILTNLRSLLEGRVPDAPAPSPAG
jgi:uncharacterized protein YndB with AHSA1/START domain